MIYILIFLITILLLLSYFLTNKDILSPWFISCSMYLISTIFLAINAENWNVEIGAKTVLTIICALIIFGVGELVVRYAYEKRTTTGKKSTAIQLPNNGRPIVIPTYQIGLITVAMLIILMWYFKETYRLSLLGGNPGDYTLMLKYARSASVTNAINPILTLLLALCTSMAYFLIFVIMYNKIYFDKKVKWRVYLIPLIFFVGQLVLTTGRQFFIQLITTFIIISFILIKRKNNWSRKNKKLIYIGLLAILLFLGLFFLLGFLTNKSFLGFYRTISIYIGSSIVGLDHYLKNPTASSPYIGGNTLFGIYASLGQFGFSVPKLYAPLEFFYIGYDGSNIYTPLRRYIQDFSFLGMCLIQLLLGMIYASALMYIRSRQKIGVSIIIFAMFFYPIVESAIEERFFMLILSFNAAFKAFGVIFFYWLFVSPKKERKKL
ncbi:O-antigen ligase [Bacillus paranthracis]|uniref:O-antigen polymerase n=1 Tax=Bacillus paranthracis TaxID=2026186 RepID=UPI00254C46C5|nr:O-antigen polymerase [Bacillus paranthracis]MDK7472873.1 O-antigen ligase [Bacillus paranthracis]